MQDSQQVTTQTWFERNENAMVLSGILLFLIIAWPLFMYFNYWQGEMVSNRNAQKLSGMTVLSSQKTNAKAGNDGAPFRSRVPAPASAMFSNVRPPIEKYYEDIKSNLSKQGFSVGKLDANAAEAQDGPVFIARRGSAWLGGKFVRNNATDSYYLIVRYSDGDPGNPSYHLSY